MSDFLKEIRKHRIVIVYRGQSPEDCVSYTGAFAEVGIRFYEVTLNSPSAIRTIQLLRQEFGDKIHVGAGTVKTTEEVDEVKEAGGSYIVSPHTSFNLIKRTKEKGLFSIPGAFTPTEIMNAIEAGADMIKVFPINVVGAELIRQLKAPLDNVPFMATGGVTLDLVRQLIDVGTDAVGMGIHLLGQQSLEKQNMTKLQRSAEQFMQMAKVI